MSYEVLGGIIDVLISHINSLERSEKRIKDTESPSAIASIMLYKSWKASLLKITAKAKETYEEAKRGNKLAASIDSCALADMVNNVLISSNPEDPVFMELRPVLTYLKDIALASCSPDLQPTIQP
ncbi:hypothetical protein ASAC_0304 [Acidilobus saccharovorans 345-15]|uniref:Uncharacterized protein n=1 Tax=Acidilobus saccharovorans (strain DSM 16705 / JCM 18335 / VKM B-2471 / 345-15) TaxID=666510 RepID=D9Q073_ACIS3|nr:hypothetical protein [Acidilobus saccharovorans]ADL18711.1 hypothetical protein ASAC_0304 [Acidilobus saccharovorans 345-15]